MRTNFYIDAFNLYYGCVNGTAYKWLNLESLCQLSFPRDLVHRIRYFTARVKARPSDPQQPIRQAMYLRALKTLPSVSIHYGHYLQKPVMMPYVTPPARGPATVRVLKSEEKGSDVNLATLLLVDAFDGDFEQAVVVSNDSDLGLPIELVQTKFGSRSSCCSHAAVAASPATTSAWSQPPLRSSRRRTWPPPSSRQR